MQISEKFFLYFKSNTPILWNFETHEQFEIDIQHLVQLLNLSNGEDIPPEYTEVFREAGVLSNTADDHWNWDILSKIFHLGTKDIPITINENASPKEWVKEYLEFCDEIGPEPEKKNFQRDVFKLPDPSGSELENYSLSDAFFNRKTTRQFHNKTLPLSKLSNILHYSFGYIHGEWDKEFQDTGLAPTAKRKATPSGGGLHPIEAYIAIFNVESLENDIYYYNPDHHHLERLNNKPIDLTDELPSLLWGQYYCSGISFGIFLTARLDLAAWKYKHSRAYRNVLLDTGHISQTFQLCATAEGVNTWITGVFNDSKIEQLLGIDGVNETALFFVSGGYGKPVAFDGIMKEVIDEHS